jgi:hypothetical protein
MHAHLTMLLSQKRLVHTFNVAHLHDTIIGPAGVTEASIAFSYGLCSQRSRVHINESIDMYVFA